MSHVGKMSPLHAGLVEGAQQPAADQRERGRGQRQPLLRARHLGLGVAAVFGREDGLLVVSVAPPLLPEVLAAHVLEDGEAEGVEQEVPRLVLLLHEAARRQAEGVSDCAGQQQRVELRQGPLAAAAAAAAPRWRLRKTTERWSANSIYMFLLTNKSLFFSCLFIGFSVGYLFLIIIESRH